MSSNTDTIRELAQQEYKWGFVTDIGEDRAPKGLNEDIIRLISAKKNEPEFMLEWRLKAFRHWESLEKAQAEPKWANIHYPPIDYQDISYYSAPKQKPNLKSLDELDPEILRTYEKLGIPLAEQKMLAGVAVDAVFDSVSVATTFKEKLAEVGVIFCSFSEAVQNHPSWSRSISAPWCLTPTISLPRSMRRSSPTGRSSTCPRAFAARWSFPPTSASTPRKPASSSAL